MPWHPYGVIEQYERDQRRDCVAGGLPALCDNDKQSITALPKRGGTVAPLPLSKLEESQVGLAEVIATQEAPKTCLPFLMNYQLATEAKTSQFVHGVT